MLLLLVGLVTVLLYFLVLKPRSFWRNRGVPYANSWPILGNVGDIVFKRKPLAYLVKDLYTAFPNNRYYGTLQFNKPILILRDVELIKRILVKDFDHFVDHSNVLSEDVDPLMGRNLASLRGQRWRNMRATLSPSFTSSKMRSMFALLTECADQFINYYKRKGDQITSVEMKDIFTRFTNDAIASVAFGLRVNSLEDRENEFYMMAKNATNRTGFQAVKFFFCRFNPGLMKLLKIPFFQPSVSSFFRQIVKENIKQRENSGVVRPDMIHLLMEARKGQLHHEHDEDDADAGFATVQESHVGKQVNKNKTELSDDDITAQALIFLFGGFDTSATLLSFITYELAVNPEVQENLRREVDETLEKCSGGKITYDKLLEMKYLDMVISETLRKWPPGFQLDRTCVKDYKISPESPEERSLTLKKGQLVKISAIGLHYDPKYFSNPEQFDPERFSDENKHRINPYSYMPFGAGPRSCIASRFALLENKVLIFYLLATFNIIPIEKTPIPLVLGTKSFNLEPIEGFWLGLQLRKKI